MRARNIKPGFFKNEDLAELPMETRMLFIGLWLLADREGRLEDRPKRIKAELFAFENLDIDSMLNQLQSYSFLVRYEVDGKNFIQVENFVKHQDPHYKEKKSEIPPIPGREDFIKATGITRSTKQRILERDNYQCQACGSTDGLCIDHIIPASRGGDSSDENLQILCISCNTKKGNKFAGEDKGCKKSKHDSSSVLVRSNIDPTLIQRNSSLPSDSLTPDSLIPDSLIKNPPTPLQGDDATKPKKKRTPKDPDAYTSEFEKAWAAYPRKDGKRKAFEAWQKATKRDMPVDDMPEHIESRSFEQDWRKDEGRFIPHMATWLNRDGWLDEGAKITPRQAEEEGDFWDVGFYHDAPEEMPKPGEVLS